MKLVQSDILSNVVNDITPASILEYNDIPSQVSIVIDNGSSRLRAGYSCDENPCVDIDNLIVKYNRKTDSKVFYDLGNTSSTSPFVSQNMTKISIRSPFEQDVPINFDVMETTLDGLFCTLGIGDYPIDHPLVLTEIPCNPSRKLTSELLFEAYGIPRVSLGTDALFSLYNTFGNNVFDPQPRNLCVLSSGNYSTYSIPFVNGSLCKDFVRRIPIGAVTHSSFMLRLMQLKYPYFPTKMPSIHAQASVKNFCYVAEHFTSELRKFRDSSEYLYENDLVLQYPIPQSSYSSTSSLPEDEQTRIMDEKKRLFSEKMKVHSEKKRQEKIITLQTDILGLRKMQSNRENYETEQEYQEMLKDYGYESAADLDQVLFEFETKLEKLQFGKVSSQKETTSYDFSVLDVPDLELSDDKIKEKRKLRLIKAGIDARERAKLEKEEEEHEEQKEHQKRIENPEKWIAEKRAQRLLLKSKLKQLRQAREGLSDRKSHSSISRIKSLTSLVHSKTPADIKDGNIPPKKRKKTGSENNSNNRDDDDDPHFGDNESDWSIYKELNKGRSQEKETFEDEEKIENELSHAEDLLFQYDPRFWDLEKSEKKISFFDHFFYGVDGVAELQMEARNDTNPFALPYQLHMNIEKFRVPEILFQPSILGLGCMGIVEVLDETFSNIRRHQYNQLASTEDVYLTGGNTCFPGLPLRLFTDLQACRPSGTTLNIFSPQSSIPLIKDITPSYHHFNSAWKGAADWASKSHNQSGFWISRADYEEEGIERCISQFKSSFFIY